MTFKVVKFGLSADVAASGTLTLPYPSGSVQADFDPAGAHLAAIAGANLTSAGSDFSLTFNGSDITFTNGATNFTLPKGQILRVQMEEFTADEAGADQALTNLDLGASGQAGTLDIFPSTASKGKVRFSAADSAGDTLTEIKNASQAAARTYTVPDAGADADFLMSKGAQATTGIQTMEAIAGGDSSLAIDGLAAAQGGAVPIKGGTSATAGNAGGAASLTGGTPGVTSKGGAASVVGGIGGATSGAGGDADVVSGAGSATPAGGASGAASLKSGIAEDGVAAEVASASGAVTVGSGAGALSVTGTGGATGAATLETPDGGATSGAAGTGGAAGDVNVTAGAGGADGEGGSGTGGAGGSVVLTAGLGGAGNTPGAAGTIDLASLVELLSGQIKFPSTAVPSADVNTLDDYEEGTWTPVLTFATPGDLSVVYSAQVGWYTKIGRLVTLSAAIQTSTFTHTTASGSMEITGLPFTSDSAANHLHTGTLNWSGFTQANMVDAVSFINPNAAILGILYSQTAAAIVQVDAGDMPTTGTVIIRFTIQYIV